jgi:hypothetical protein
MKTSPFTLNRALLVSTLLAGAGLLLGGCESETSGYTTEQGYPVGASRYPYGQPAYPASQPVYQPAYPYGQPVYSNGQPVYASGYDDYIYYPEAGVYFDTTRSEYIYPYRDHWEHRHEPPRVPQWGPSVQLWFHDSPEYHHAEVMRRYPGHGRRYDDRYRRHRDWDRDGD